MSNYNTLKNDIDNNIFENQNQQITGAALNSILKEMVNTLGEGYQFGGIVTPESQVPSSDAKLFFVACTEGEYNFVDEFGDHIEVAEGEVAIIYGTQKAVIAPSKWLTLINDVPSFGYDESDPITLAEQMGHSIEDVLAKGFVVYNEDVTTNHYIVVGDYGAEGGYITFIGVDNIYQYDVNASGYITGEKVTSLAPDDELSDTSENAVQNKVVKAAMDAMDAAKQDVLTFDDAPTENSNNPVKSGGVKTALNELGQQVIYDVTMNNNNHPTFASLSALLSDANLSTLIPANVRCGGMSIRFVQTSDNTYVQYRLMSDSFNTAEANWEGVDATPSNSNNLIKSKGVFNELNKTNNTLNLLNGITKSAGARSSTNFDIPLLSGTNILVECSSENASYTNFGGYLNDGSLEDIRRSLQPGSKTEITLTKDYTRFFAFSNNSHTETLYAGISIKTENLVKNVGDIQSLTTENKSNIVSAINEINSYVIPDKVYDISGDKNQSVIINTPFNSGETLIFFNVGSNTAWFGGYLSDGSFEDISSRLGPQQYEIITLTKNYTKLYTYSSYGNYQVIINKLKKKEIYIYEIINGFKNQLSSIDANSYKEIGLSPFIKFGSVGDSLSVGEWHEVGTTYVNTRDLKNSWGQILARKYGNTCLNFGYAGATCKSFLTSETHGFAELAQITEGEKINLCQAYIIGLGTNDTDTIGTPEDIDWSDYNNNGDTFYGNYAKLVQKIREFAPKSIIFCLSIPYPRNSVAKNTVISYIANNENLEGVYLVDLASNPYNAIYASASVQGFYYEGHFNAAGYAICANIMDRAIGDTIIANNTDAYIRNISGIPYGTNIIE